MTTSQISIPKRTNQDFGAPENLNVTTKKQLENLLRESITDTRKGYTVSQVKASLTRSRERAAI